MSALRVLLAACLLAALMLVTSTADAWIENHVLGDEITITVSPDGSAVVEHRLRFHTNGNVRFREYALHGVDADAQPLENSYAIPAKAAHANSLEAATPLTLTVKHPKSRDGDAEPTRLDITVDDEKGLRRGHYVLVLRYRTNLIETGAVAHDGAFARISWKGPIFEDGFDNARTTFVIPKAPTPPRAPSETNSERDDGEADTLLAETRRNQDSDELELLRTYTAKGEAVTWIARVDPRALTNAAGVMPDDAAPSSAPPAPPRDQLIPISQEHLGMGALLLFLLTLGLVGLKSMEVDRLATAARAEMPPLLPLPGWMRAPLAGAALASGVALQLVFDQVVGGALLVLFATCCTVYRPARVDSKAVLRGPGTWLNVSESEALRGLPRPTGGWLDFSTWAGKALMLLLLGALAFAVWVLHARSLWHGVLLGADAVFILALLGTGMGRALPPDMTVEPARFLVRVLKRLRKRKDLADVRFVPRIRLPAGEVDPDEVRLLIAPRHPLRGFHGIEIGVTYAVGMGARVAMPEVLVRVAKDSACEEALAAISRVGRSSRGRKKDERTISLAPRFPTVRMTAEIAAAVAVRVLDRAPRRAPKPVSAKAAKKRAA